MSVKIYKLKNGKSKGDWQLPLTDILVERIKDSKKIGLRKLKFVPGTNSFWKEDLSGDLVPQQIWFTNGKLSVPREDKLLNGLLQIHPFFNKYFELFDKEAESKRKLEALKATDKVLLLINEADPDKIVATAFAVFKQQAIGWNEFDCELQLRELAKEKPKSLSDALSTKTYESSYLAALAFGKGIVRTNSGKSAIIWNDTTQGEITKIAKGQSGVLVLGEYLSKVTEESELVLQTIGEKLDEKATNIPKKVDSNESEKDKEIAALKKQLEEAKKGKSNDVDLTDLQEQYKEKFEVDDVPARFKNDAEWISKKLTK